MHFSIQLHIYAVALTFLLPIANIVPALIRRYPDIYGHYQIFAISETQMLCKFLYHVHRDANLCELALKFT